MFCVSAPPLQNQGSIKHFSSVFHFSAVFGPNGPHEATSTEKISTEPPVFVASPAPLSPNEGTQDFYPAFRQIPRCSFSSSKNLPWYKTKFLIQANPFRNLTWFKNFASKSKFLNQVGPFIYILWEKLCEKFVWKVCVEFLWKKSGRTDLKFEIYASRSPSSQIHMESHGAL